MRFALMQVKTGLCHILSRFEVAPCKETPVRIVYERTSFLLQMNGEFRLSFNRMHFWSNTYVYIFIFIHTYICVYICIYIYALYILNIDTINYLLTPLHKALLERPVFSRQVGSCSVHYKLSTSWLLEPTYWYLKQNFRNYFINPILKSHFWMSDLIVKFQN